MDRYLGEYDFYAASKILGVARTVGVAKANLETVQTMALGVLAGAFIAFGAMFYTFTIIGSEFGWGPTRLLGGVAFSLGLILGGAELFTGNNLLAIAWAERLINTKQVLRNWALVYAGNLIGAVATAWFVHLSGIYESGQVSMSVVGIARAKLALDPGQVFVRGILCNALVCLAVWLSFAAESVASKILAIVPPVAAFVALGFEHSVANMYFLPVAWFSGASDMALVDVVGNLVWATAGNIIGGSVLVALIYWIVYRVPRRGL